MLLRLEWIDSWFVHIIFILAKTLSRLGCFLSARSAWWKPNRTSSGGHLHQKVLPEPNHVYLRTALGVFYRPLHNARSWLLIVCLYLIYGLIDCLCVVLLYVVTFHLCVYMYTAVGSQGALEKSRFLPASLPFRGKLRIGKLSSKNLHMGMWCIYTLLHGHIKAVFKCTKCTALGMAYIGCMLAAVDVHGCY